MGTGARARPSGWAVWRPPLPARRSPSTGQGMAAQATANAVTVTTGRHLRPATTSMQPAVRLAVAAMARHGAVGVAVAAAGARTAVRTAPSRSASPPRATTTPAPRSSTAATRPCRLDKGQRMTAVPSALTILMSHRRGHAVMPQPGTGTGRAARMDPLPAPRGPSIRPPWTLTCRAAWKPMASSPPCHRHRPPPGRRYQAATAPMAMPQHATYQCAWTKEASRVCANAGTAASSSRTTRLQGHALQQAVPVQVQAYRWVRRLPVGLPVPVTLTTRDLRWCGWACMPPALPLRSCIITAIRSYYRSLHYSPPPFRHWHNAPAATVPSSRV